MRRGTQSAIFFGYLLSLIRTEQKKSMREIADKIEGNPATVSQIEKGQRALKEPKIEIWAIALGVRKIDLKELWFLSQGLIRHGNKDRMFYTDFQDLRFDILKIMNRYVKIQKIDIPRIERPLPITRSRYKSSEMILDDLIKQLQSSERSRVQGYIEAIIECRPNSQSPNKKEQ